MNCKSLLFIAIMASQTFFAAAQSDQNSATVIDPFSLSADKTGTLSNSVNLFTGDVALPLSLVSFPGRDGIGINVSFSYSSANIETTASLWNLDAPTSVVGLGWSMPQSKIIVDNNQTASREDDIFYLSENGSSNRLVCVGNSAGVRTFKTKNYANKIITYTEASERWDVTMENGVKLVYGNSATSAVEWIAYKDNWVGDGYYVGSYQQGIAWNLSSATNIWGDQITYAYTKTENKAGSTTGINHTEACYLASITDSYGHEVDLIYNNKLAEEVMEPHTEKVEPDAYQERYERKYLDRILVKVDGVQYYEIDLRYTFYSAGSLSYGNNTKRLLASIMKVGLSSTLGPVTKFSYVTSGPMTAALSSITLPTGGTVTYDYSTGITLSNAPAFLNLTAPSGYQEPQVYPSDDYTVVTWRQLTSGSHDGGLKPIKMFAYYWNGKWREADLSGTLSQNQIQKIGSNASNSQKNFQIALGKDFFGTLIPDNSSPNYSWLDIYKKDEGTSDTWTHGGSYHIQFFSASDPEKRQIFAGNNFIAVTDNYGNVMAYRWTGTAWTLALNNQETQGTHYTVAANNYIFSMTAGSPGSIKFYHVDEQGVWASPVSVTSSAAFNTTTPMYLYASNTHVLAMRSGASAEIVSWDKSYQSNLFSTFDTGVNYGVDAPVYISESTVGIGPSTDINSYVKAFSYYGLMSTWQASSQGGAYGSFGESVMLAGGGGGSAVSGLAFNPNTTTWGAISSGTSSGTHYAADVGYNYAIYNGFFNYRYPNGWSYVAAPTSFLAAELGGGQALPRQLITKGNMYFIKNGSIQSTEWATNTPYPYEYWQVHFAPNGGWTKMLGPKSFALGPGDAPGTPDINFYNAAKLQLVRIDARNFNGSFVDYPVIRITQNDGSLNYYTSFDYDAATALTDPDRSTAFYATVSTINGSSTTSSKPFGYTTSFFFTGLTQNEFGVSPTLPSQYRLFTGQTYRSISYNSTGTIVSQNDITYATSSVGIQNSASAYVDIAFMAQVPTITNVTDGITTVNTKTYNSLGLVTAESQVTTSSGTSQEVINTAYTYAYSKYTSVASKNMYNGMFMVKKSLNGQDIEASVTRYNEGYSCSTSGGSIPVPYDQYTWHGTSSVAEPPSSISSSPDSNWLLEGIISQRHATNGAETEVRSRAGLVKAQLWNESRRAVIASVSNATANSIAYTSFEDPSDRGNFALSGASVVSGISTTGSKYCSLGSGGITTTGLDPSRPYTISFWANATSGSVNVTGSSGAQSLGTTTGWMLFQFKVPAGNSSVTLGLAGGTVNIDELRVVPANALATTTTVHPLFGPTSSSDANNHVSITLYDNLGRPVNVVDEKGNIVKNTIYNTAK